MTWPNYVETRPVLIPATVVLEDGRALKMSVRIVADRSLIRVEDGQRLQHEYVLGESPVGGEIQFELPITNDNGWKNADTGMIISITDPSQYTHRYNAYIQFLDGTRKVGKEIRLGPFVVPRWLSNDGSDADPINLNTALSMGTTEGDSVLLPGYYEGVVRAAVASALSEFDAELETLKNRVDNLPSDLTEFADQLNALQLTVDSAAVESTPSTLMLRDSDGRSKISDPIDNLDIANKGYVDSIYAYVARGEGFDPTGQTDSQPAFQALMDSIPTRSKTSLDRGQVNVVVPPGHYLMNDTLVVDLFKNGLIAPWHGVTFDFRNIGAKVALHLWSSTQGNASAFVGGRTPSPMTSLYGIQIQGPRGAASDPTPPDGNIGLWIHGTGNGTTGNHKMESVTVRGFNTGVLLGDHAYCLTFDSFLVHRCGTGFDITPGLTDSGERLNIVNSTVYGCKLAIRNSDDCRWHISNSSFDYNTKVFEQGSNGVGFFRDCHFEQYMYRSDIATEWFSTTGGSLEIEGGIIACSTSNPNSSPTAFPPFLVRNNSDPSSGNKVSVKGTRITSGSLFTTDFLAGGTGVTDLDLVYTGTSGGAGQTKMLGCRAANLFADSGGNRSTLVDDWFIGEGTAGPSGAKTWNGNRSFYITSPRGNWVYVGAPIESGRSYGARARVAYSTAPSEGIAVRFVWAKVVNGAVKYTETIVERTYEVSQLTNNFDTSVIPNAGTTPTRAPSWATHILIGYYSPGGGIYTTELLATPR